MHVPPSKAGNSAAERCHLVRTCTTDTIVPPWPLPNPPFRKRRRTCRELETPLEMGPRKGTRPRLKRRGKPGQSGSPEGTGFPPVPLSSSAALLLRFGETDCEEWADLGPPCPAEPCGVGSPWERGVLPLCGPLDGRWPRPVGVPASVEGWLSKPTQETVPPRLLLRPENWSLEGLLCNLPFSVKTGKRCIVLQTERQK